MNLTFVSQRVQRGHCVHWQTAAELENICQHRRLQRKASSQVVWTLQKAACRRPLFGHTHWEARPERLAGDLAEGGYLVAVVHKRQFRQLAVALVFAALECPVEERECLTTYLPAAHDICPLVALG